MINPAADFECKGKDRDKCSLIGPEFDCEVCFCGQILCEIRPKLMTSKTSGHFVNQKRLFYDNVNEAKEEWRPNLEKEKEKSSIYVAAHGERVMEGFKGHCYVCESNFSDYLEHINKVEHKDLVTYN